jgi:hypothetical protein
MEEIPKEIFIGALGSILGVLILYLAQSGIQLTKKARDAAKQKREQELEMWKSMKMGVRQGITNSYLFKILQYLFLGNLLWLAPEVVSAPAQALEFPYAFYLTIIIGFKGSALLSFYYGLGQILRYQKLRLTDEA